ncbi:hypothetical protein MBLNU13_g06594t1 [Cladosporium sp. NU13]
MMMRNDFVQVVFTLLAITLFADAATHLAKRQVAATDETTPAWQSQGCWSDNVNNRTLSLMADAGDHVSNDKCQALCSQLGYRLAGTEYAGECYCGDRLNGLAEQISAEHCNMACTGDASQVCGGPDAVSLYWDGTGAPLQPSDDGTSTGSSTIASTSSATSPLPSEPFDTDSTTPTSTSASPIPPASDASLPSSAPDSFTTSGSSIVVVDSTASSSLPIPSTTSVTSSLSSNAATDSSTTTTPPTSTKPTTTPSPTVVTTNLPLNFTYQGCYVDSMLARILPVQQPDSNTLTVEGCINTCSSLGYSTAGVEWQTDL